MQSRTTEHVSTRDYGPWRVTTKIVRTVERVRRHPEDYRVQPVFRIVNGRPVPALPGIPVCGVPESPSSRSWREGTRLSIRHAAMITGLPGWELWAEWLAVLEWVVDPAVYTPSPIRSRRRRSPSST